MLTDLLILLVLVISGECGCLDFPAPARDLQTQGSYITPKSAGQCPTVGFPFDKALYFPVVAKEVGYFQAILWKVYLGEYMIKRLHSNRPRKMDHLLTCLIMCI